MHVPFSRVSCLLVSCPCSVCLSAWLRVLLVRACLGGVRRAFAVRVPARAGALRACVCVRAPCVHAACTWYRHVAHTCEATYQAQPAFQLAFLHFAWHRLPSKLDDSSSRVIVIPPGYTSMHRHRCLWVGWWVVGGWSVVGRLVGPTEPQQALTN